MDSNPLIIIIFIGSVLGSAAGIIMHRSDYCIAGMFRDLFIFRHAEMLRTLMLLIIVGMMVFEVARQLGLLPLYPFPLLGSPSLTNVIGGFIFGVGMVLAGGCVVGTLYKMGAGSILSASAFIGLLMGSALYAEIHPWWTTIAKATTFFQGSITIPQVMNVNPIFFITGLASISAFFFYQWYRDKKWTRPAQVEGYLQPWKAALLLGLIGFLSYLFIGMPLGITTAYSKMGTYVESIFFPSHVEQLTYLKTLPLDYLDPLTKSHLQGGPGPRLDAITAIQFPLIFGIVLGGALSALLLREFKVYAKLPLRQYVSAVSGGLIMGMASRMAPACNVWHLLGGLPILAMQSILFLIGLFPGAWIGSRILTAMVLKR